jgi:hypothetical protein
VIVLAPALWSATVAQLRDCGGARRECVGYWTGPIGEPQIVDQLVHPKHNATAGSYDLDRRWLHEFWVQLHRQQREVRVQIHTHASLAFHSRTDDEWPIVHTPGFCSLVIPNFATRFDSNDLFLAQIDENGSWQERAVPDLLAGIHDKGVSR